MFGGCEWTLGTCRNGNIGVVPQQECDVGYTNGKMGEIHWIQEMEKRPPAKDEMTFFV